MLSTWLGFLSSKSLHLAIDEKIQEKERTNSEGISKI